MQNTESAAPRPRAIYWVLSLALAAALLYYSLRGIDWLRVWQILRHAKIAVVGLTLAMMSLALAARAIRWRVLLSANTPVPVSMAFWATAAGYLGNNLLPARAGEFVRTVIVSRRSGMSKSFVLTTAFSERVVDAIVLITISATVLLTLPYRPGWIAQAARPFAAIGIAGIAAIALLPAFEPLAESILRRLPVPAGMRQRLERMLQQGVAGIRTFHDARRLARFLALTAVIWSIDGISTVVGAHAIGIAISFPVAFLLVAGLGLGSALPSTPGYVGIYQFVAVSILTPFGLTRTDAIAYILLFQAMNYAVLLFWGSLGMSRQKKLS